MINITRLITTTAKFWYWVLFGAILGFIAGWISGAQVFVAKEARATSEYDICEYVPGFCEPVTFCHCEQPQEGQEAFQCQTLTLPFIAVLNGHNEHENDYLGECVVPEPEVCEDEAALNYGEEGDCEYEEEPTPTPEPPRTTTEALAPVCPNNVPVRSLINPHVIRNGSDATVNAFVPEGDRINVYFRTSGQSVWQHGLADVPVVNGYVSVTIHDLVATGDYDFGIQASNGCAGGEIVAVIVDSWQPRTFSFTRWERL